MINVPAARRITLEHYCGARLGLAATHRIQTRTDRAISAQLSVLRRFARREALARPQTDDVSAILGLRHPHFAASNVLDL